MKALCQATLLSVLLILPLVNGCSSNDNAPSTAAAVGGTLYQQLGGADGVTKLANQFGANIASNPTLNQILDSVVIGQITNGFTNDVMKASGMAPNGAETLASALSGKGLNSSHVTALTNSLKEAGAAVGVNPTLMGTVASTVVEPAVKSAAGM